jgi:hypothetical protein
LKSSPEARRLVREKLVHTESRLLDEVNRVFEEARLAVQRARDSQGRQKYEDLVLIFDNLEKIQRFEGREEGLASQREFFLERSAQLSSLRIHTILTVPLRLVRSVDGPQLTQRHGSEPYVLPMVKVIQRGTRAPYEPGLERVRAMLRKRLGNLTLDEALTTEAQAFLLNYSGGHTRNLVNFLRNACAYAQAAPIPLRAVQQAVLQTVRTYSAAIPESHWDKLATLELSSEQQIVNGDPDYLKMLENLSVLEYINGGGPDFSFQASEQWYAVNPLVRELTRFKEAVQRLGA